MRRGDGLAACLRQERLRWPRTAILASSEFANSAPGGHEPPVKAVTYRPYSLSTLCDNIRQAYVDKTQLAAMFMRQAKAVLRTERSRCERSLGTWPA